MKSLVMAAGLALAGCSNKDSGPPTDTGPEEGPPEIELSVDELLFEATAVNTTASHNITVRNLGRTELEVQSVDAPPPFRTTFSPVTLQPGGAGIITVIFAPTAHGQFEEVVSVLSTDPVRPSVSVTCTGETIDDADGDGYDAGVGPGLDCDDDNPNINPAADEIWYNGVDNNCTCELAPRCSDYDQDLDGYEHIDFNNDLDDGHDCNDVNPDINPGASDAWYDGYDTNCDGWNDNDQDRDGFSSSEHTESGTDCDDLDPTVNTDGKETYNGKDDDCDGDVDAQILAQDTPVVIIGGANDEFGRGLTSGIIDPHDFASEVIAGAPGYGAGGAIFVFRGGAFPPAESLAEDTADAMVEGDNDDGFGTEVAYLEDFGKGGTHLVVGAPAFGTNQGYAAVLLASSVMDSATLGDATVLQMEGTTSGAYVGQGLANDLDLDGDGFTELLGGARAGDDITLWLVAGDTTLSGSQPITAADAQFTVSGTGSAALDGTLLKTFPGGGHDFDGDGYEDFLFCNGTAGEDGYGEVYMLWGDSTPYDNSSAEDIDSVASVIATGTSTLDIGLVCGTAGDWTGDGKAEVWMYSESDTDLYVVEGDESLRDGAVDLSTTFLALYPFDSHTNYPAELRDAGDLDGAVGAMHEMAIAISADAPSTSVTPGQIFVLGPDLGFGVLPDAVENLAQAHIQGDAVLDSENYGEAISGRAADVTGVGGAFRPDLVVADPGFLSDAGAVYVYANYNE
jgi:hypothetical protein